MNKSSNPLVTLVKITPIGAYIVFIIVELILALVKSMTFSDIKGLGLILSIIYIFVVSICFCWGVIPFTVFMATKGRKFKAFMGVVTFIISLLNFIFSVIILSSFSKVLEAFGIELLSVSLFIPPIIFTVLDFMYMVFVSIMSGKKSKGSDSGV